MQCPRCKYLNDEQARSCVRCGAALAPPASRGAEWWSHAGFGPRLGAWVVDVIVLVVAGVATSGIGAAAYALVYVGLTVSQGQSLGKMAIGIRVVDAQGRPPGLLRALVREVIGKPVSFAVLCIGVLWIVGEEKKRGWHDLLAGTYVVHLVRCPKCRHGNIQGDLSCVRCEAPLSERAPASAPVPSPAAQRTADEKTCPSCGAVNQAYRSACRVCGKPIEAGLAHPLFCTRCGRDVQEGARFCTTCGNCVVITLEEWPFGTGHVAEQ